MTESTNQKTDYTSKTEEEACAKKKALMLNSKGFMDREFTKNAKRYRKMFRGDHWGAYGSRIDSRKNDLVVVNYVYSILKSVIPQTYYQDPYFDVYVNDPSSMGKMFTPEMLKLKMPDGTMPILDELLKREQLTEDAINQKWRQLLIKQTMKRIQLDQMIMGFGAGKVGWNTEKNKDYSKPNMETGQEYTERVTEDDAFFLRVSTEDILFDNSAKHFDEMRWLSTRYFLPREYVEEKFKAEGNFKSVNILSNRLIQGFNEDQRKAFEMVEIWEFQDLGEDKFFYMTDGYDKYLNEVDNQYDIGFNTKILYVNDCPDQLMPISDVSQIEDLNMELNRTRTQMLNHRRKIQRKILAEPDAFKSQEEFNRFMNDDDMQVCEMKSGALTEKKVLIVQPGIVPPDFYHIDEINKDDIYQVSGTGANQLAAEGLVSKTATEANIIEKNANLRNKERVDSLDDYCEDLARSLLSIMQKFPKTTTFRQRDKQVWIKYSNKDIQGDYSVDIKIGSMQRPNDQLQTEVLMNVMPKFLEMRITTPEGAEMPIFNVKEVFRATMKKTGFTETEIMKMMETQSETPPLPAGPTGPAGPGPGGVDPLMAMLGGGIQ